ncbi:MAG: hypothetical protein A3D44_03975 [Candidatus Staskawiczbacteria bacterium RIFCSPHIGHO2_02_FULL_42_22]|uniref:Uncharacterized protein n=1 Tax=Candidatus Staskawiczbacteria bacterium RIFCSPHIGHO2_02_FULL_42_22 TaxID=1802207 RepID=A0A1G2I1K9_9BACT|nr:MAG: hypothetical protein A3D44_03975 [Candidatus Staskawiczbacteria bacterium RIFCSPHIGHO2_02_FULL_42_22]
MWCCLVTPYFVIASRAPWGAARQSQIEPRLLRRLWIPRNDDGKNCFPPRPKNVTKKIPGTRQGIRSFS